MAAEQKHTLLVVPGFYATQDRLDYIQEKTSKWRLRGLIPQVVPVSWGEQYQTIQEELDEQVVDEINCENKVSLVGISAGGPPAIAALINNPQVDKVVTISSRLRPIEIAGFQTHDDISKLSPASADAITWLEEHNALLLPDMRARVMNTRSQGDNQVHPSMSYIPGAENVWMPPARNHIKAVSDALTVHSDVIVDFLTK